MKIVAWVIYYLYLGMRDLFDDIKHRLPASRDCNCWPWETDKIHAYNDKLIESMVEKLINGDNNHTTELTASRALEHKPAANTHLH